MSSINRADSVNLGESELARLNDVASGHDDPSGADEAVSSVASDVVETADEFEIAASREVAARFLAAIDRPLWSFDPGQLSLGPETSTFLRLVAAREVALSGQKRPGGGDR